MDAGKPSQLLGPFAPGASLGKADVRFKGLVATLTEAQRQNPIPKSLKLEFMCFVWGIVNLERYHMKCKM